MRSLIASGLAMGLFCSAASAAQAANPFGSATTPAGAPGTKTPAAAATPAKPATPAKAADPACPIKGNVNGKGEKVYHTPASPQYARIKMNQAEGDTCFKTEKEASAAGFRAPKAMGAQPKTKQAP